MFALETINARNTEVAIRAILNAAACRGVQLTRDEVLEELKFDEHDDTSVWSATVDRLMAEPS